MACRLQRCASARAALAATSAVAPARAPLLLPHCPAPASSGGGGPRRVSASAGSSASLSREGSAGSLASGASGPINKAVVGVQSPRLYEYLLQHTREPEVRGAGGRG
jgi:hypothetical protein